MAWQNDIMAQARNFRAQTPQIAAFEQAKQQQAQQALQNGLQAVQQVQDYYSKPYNQNPNDWLKADLTKAGWWNDFGSRLGEGNYLAEGNNAYVKRSALDGWNFVDPASQRGMYDWLSLENDPGIFKNQSILAAPKTVYDTVQQRVNAIQDPEWRGLTIGELNAKVDASNQAWKSAYAKYVFGLPAGFKQEATTKNRVYGSSPLYQGQTNNFNLDAANALDVHYQGDAEGNVNPNLWRYLTIAHDPANNFAESGFFLKNVFNPGGDNKNNAGFTKLPQDLGANLNKYGVAMDVPGEGQGWYFPTWDAYTNAVGNGGAPDMSTTRNWIEKKGGGGGLLGGLASIAGPLLSLGSLAFPMLAPVAAGFNLTQGAMTGNVGQALGGVMGIPGVATGLTGAVGSGLNSAGLSAVTAAKLAPHVTSGLVGTAGGVLSGQNFDKALTGGLASGLGSYAGTAAAGLSGLGKVGQGALGGMVSSAVKTGILGGNVGEAAKYGLLGGSIAGTGREFGLSPTAANGLSKFITNQLAMQQARQRVRRG